MAIRVRRLEGKGVVALCAVESDEQEGDLYLDDEVHYALAAKFALDWQGETIDWQYPDIWADMETQKLRDAFEVDEQLREAWQQIVTRRLNERIRIANDY